MKTLSVQDIQQIIADKIPQGLVVPEHTESAHFYRLTCEGGGLYASVTTKSSAMASGNYLKMWAANMAADQLCEAIIRNPSIITDKEMLALAKKSAVMAHQNYFEDAGTTGTAGHSVVEKYLNEWIRTGVRPADIKEFIEPSEPDYRVFATARSAELFCHDFDVIPIASELLVASKKYKYAGTLDSLMMVAKVTKKGIPGMCQQHTYMDTKSGKLRCLECNTEAVREFAIVDWKTSNSIDKDAYALQVAAYWQALYEMTGLKAKSVYIVQLDKGMSKYNVRILNNRIAAFKAFTHVIQLYDWMNDGSKKLLPINPKIRVSVSQLS